MTIQHLHSSVFPISCLLKNISGMNTSTSLCRYNDKVTTYIIVLILYNIYKLYSRMKYKKKLSIKNVRSCYSYTLGTLCTIRMKYKKFPIQTAIQLPLPWPSYFCVNVPNRYTHLLHSLYFTATATPNTPLVPPGTTNNNKKVVWWAVANGVCKLKKHFWNEIMHY